MLSCKLFAEKEKLILPKLQTLFNLPDNVIQTAKLNPAASHKLLSGYWEKYNAFLDKLDFFGEDIEGTTILLDIQEAVPITRQLIGNQAISFSTSALPEDMESILRRVPYAGIGKYASLENFVKANISRIIFAPHLKIISNFDLPRECWKVIYGASEDTSSDSTFAISLLDNLTNNGRLYDSNKTIVLVPTILINFFREESISLLPAMQLFLLISTICHEASHQQWFSLRENNFDISLFENERYAHLLELYVIQKLLSFTTKEYERRILFKYAGSTMAEIERFYALQSPADNVYTVNFFRKRKKFISLFKEKLSFSFQNILRKDFLERAYRERS
ncbi:hypothetical protein NO2_0149 [Candidatus Termititenax persephonae]|uniref:Uncharacterized protein n=1 Tax=Candidatus Termititenax persephonae TaxID=2218525 RepID=A0A388TEK5_9BACT|nr:hypothetical protein NO2_0149 [Candidatus Termititenax persephonae]